jgi:electron transport complex protein RnfB
MSPMNAALADRIDSVLPQTQCTKCGYNGCRPYAEAIAAAVAPINQCPPGGVDGIERLSQVTGHPVVPLNPANGIERPLHRAVIDEALCIGCTLCIQACPVDAIVGAARFMHSVIPEWCNGCDLCVAPCPMDCIAMVPVQPPRKWNDEDALISRSRYEARCRRLELERDQRDSKLLQKAQSKLDELAAREDFAADPVDRKRAVVQAAIERARARRQSTVKP